MGLSDPAAGRNRSFVRWSWGQSVWKAHRVSPRHHCLVDHSQRITFREQQLDSCDVASIIVSSVLRFTGTIALATTVMNK